MKGIAIRLGIIAIIAVGGFLLRDRIAGSAGDLRVGDCFDAPTTQGVEVKDVAHHPCNEPHTAEVVLVRDYGGSGDGYPSDPDFLQFVTTHCVPAFNTYTGLDYDTDVVFDMGFFTPTSDGWRTGDREISCYAIRIDGAPMSASLKVAQ